MTSQQNRKLDTIIAKIERLQAEIINPTQDEKDALTAAKSRLIKIYKY